MTPTEGKAVFSKAASDSLKNVIIYGVSTAIIVIIGSRVRWLGIVLFGLDGLAIILGIDQAALASILGVVTFFGKIATSMYKSNDFWWDLANIVQIAECGVHAFYFTFMYRHLFR
jgi:hypothetical protein